MFLSRLNELGRTEGFLFRCHTPKEGSEADAYGFCYTPARETADRIAAWLLEKKVNSEIFYVPSKKHYLVKIPYINTFASNHFEKKPIPAELEVIKRTLSDTAEAVNPVWKNACSQLTKCIETLFANIENYHKNRTNDMIQTASFELNINFSNDPIVQSIAQYLGAKSTIDWGEIKRTVLNWCDVIKEIHSEFEKLAKGIFDACKGKPQTEIQGILTHFIKVRDEMIERHCEYTMSDVLTKTEAMRIGNLLLLQLSTLQKQIQSIKKDPSLDKWLPQCEDLCTRTEKIAGARVIKIVNSLRFTFCREENANYLKSFLNYHIDAKFSPEEKAVLDQEKAYTEQFVAENRENVTQIKREYEALNKESVSLLNEIFATQGKTEKASE